MFLTCRMVPHRLISEESIPVINPEDFGSLKNLRAVFPVLEFPPPWELRLRANQSLCET